MRQLGAIQYDPGVAVLKATTAVAAMAAFDTTNARLTVTVPKSGRITWKVQCALHGATTYPQVLLGVMDGATVRGRKASMLSGGNLAATTICAAWAEGTMSGLTPGASITLDAAFGIETAVASTALKYGGPNDTTQNNAFGALSFELWDPDPITVDSSGAADGNVTKFGGSAGTFAGGRPEVNATHWRGTALAAPTTAGVPKVAIEAAGDLAQAAADKVWGTAARVLTAGTNIVLAKGTGVTGFNDLSAAQVNAEADTALADVGVTATITGRIDANVSSRAAASTALSNVDWTSARAGKLDNLDAEVSSRLAAASYTAPDNDGIAGIKAQTDLLQFDAWGCVKVNVHYVNGTRIGGTGAPGDRWGPA